jgi:hypothetical protein
LFRVCSGDVTGYEGLCRLKKRLRLSWKVDECRKVDECKPLPVRAQQRQARVAHRALDRRIAQQPLQVYHGAADVLGHQLLDDPDSLLDLRLQLVGGQVAVPVLRSGPRRRLPGLAFRV